MHSDWSDWRTWPTERKARFEGRMAGLRAQVEQLLHEAIVEGDDENRARLMATDIALNVKAPVRSDAEWST